MDDESHAITDSLRRSERRLSSLCSYLQNNQEAEKSQLARRLHDELGGLLVATKMDIVWLRRTLDGLDPAVTSHWDRVVLSLEQAIDCKRRIIENLRPTLLDNLGLVAALRWLIEESCRETGLQCEQRYAEDCVPIGSVASIALFRVVQQAIANVVQHAHASRIEVTLTCEPTHVNLLISDDGVGIPADRLESEAAHGIGAMRQWIAALQGELNIESPAGGSGTTVLACLPRSSVLATK